MAIINGTNVGDFLVGTNDGDTIFGFEGDDTIIGGRGNDFAVMGDGNDRFVWNPGDGSDTVLGEGGFDTLEFTGANIAEQFEIRADGANAQMTRNVATITMELDSVERIGLATLGGADTVHVGDLSGSKTTQVAIDLGDFNGSGGDGANDTVIVDGRDKSDHIHIIADQAGIAVSGLPAAITIAHPESGDTLQVNGFGGNDTIDVSGLQAAPMHLALDGGAGTDTVNFTGSDAGETIQVVANGGRALLTDSDGAVSLDLNQVEKLNIIASRGADDITIGDLTGTGVSNVSIDLATGPGHVLPDAEADSVTLNASFPNADTVKVSSDGNWIRVAGLPESVLIGHTGKNDHLTINTFGGDDVIDASKFSANQMHLTINAGAGADTIIGSAGDDIVNGGQGNDTALLGAGNDRFIWNPGDGSDTVNGQAGFDTLAFNGANIAEQINIFANGTHAEFTRNVATIAMDLESVERIEFRALGGADAITIGDLTGTGVKQIALDLGGFDGNGDGAADTVTANFGKGADSIHLTQAADGTVSVASPSETITITHAESGDSLIVNGFDGDDTLDASALKAGTMALTLNGGGGNDLIFGGAGAETLLGGDGNDTVTWTIGGGSDVIDGQGGIDTLAVNGGTADDVFQVFANGAKLGVTASDGSTLDVSGMEQVKIAAGTGKDSIQIGDLTGTGIGNVAIDLGAGSKGDSVSVTAGLAEVMVIESKGGHTVITNENTFQTITIDNADASDVLNITSPFGNVPGEVIQASNLAMSLHFAGGTGADTIFSGSGDDFIDGNQGNDIALMGAGNDIFNWDPGDGSDTVDGQAGFDTLRFNGSNASENIDILADGTHAELTRNIANIDMHLNSVERIELRAVGGVDNIHVHDMSGTAVKEVAIDLGSNGATGDGAVDTVTVDSTAGNDHVTIASANGIVTMTGLAAQVTISHGELDDEIVVKGNDGNDTIDASGLQSGNPHLTLDGGAGNDTLTGGHDGDLIFGGDGHDLLKGGDGADTIDGGTGNDDITGGLGDDVMGGGDGADTFHYDGALDGHDLIEGFTTGQDHLDLTKFFDSLGVDPADRADRVSITDRGDGSFDIAVDADGNKGNGAEHAVAVVFATGPLTVGQDVVVHH